MERTSHHCHGPPMVLCGVIDEGCGSRSAEPDVPAVMQTNRSNSRETCRRTRLRAAQRSKDRSRIKSAASQHIDKLNSRDRAAQRQQIGVQCFPTGSRHTLIGQSCKREKNMIVCVKFTKLLHFEMENFHIEINHRILCVPKLNGVNFSTLC